MVWQQSGAKNDFYIKDYPFENIFQRFGFKILTFFKVLGNPTKGQVHLELFCPFASEVLAKPHDRIIDVFCKLI